MQFKNFYDARNEIRKLGLKNFQQWREFCYSGKKNQQVPSRPEKVYKNRGWKNWADWLGSNIYSYSTYHREFTEAREYVRSLNLKGVEEWYQFCKSGNKPIEIPSNPNKVYANDGWENYRDWLGKTRKK